MKGLNMDQILDKSDALALKLFSDNLEMAKQLDKDVNEKSSDHLTTLEALNKNAEIIKLGLAEASDITNGKVDTRMEDMQKLEEMNAKLRETLKKNK